MMYFFPPNFKYFLRKKNIFWLIYRGFLAVGKVGKRVRPVARFLTSEKDLFRRTNVWGPLSQSGRYKTQVTGHYLTYTESILNIHKS